MDKFKRMYLGAVKHDLHAPLAAVLSETEAILNECVDDPVVTHLAKLSWSHAECLMHTLQQIKDSATIDLGEAKIHRKLFSLREDTLEVVDILTV